MDEKNIIDVASQEVNDHMFSRRFLNEGLMHIYE